MKVKSNFLKAAEQLTNPLAARLLLVFVATDEAQKPDVRVAAMTGDLGCTADALEEAFEALEAAELGEIRRIQ